VGAIRLQPATEAEIGGLQRQSDEVYLCEDVDFRIFGFRILFLRYLVLECTP
jgi:hypothetical protein